MYYSTDKLIDLRSKAGQNESGTPAVTGDSNTLATDLEVLMKEHLITESAPGVYCVSEFSPIQLSLCAIASYLYFRAAINLIVSQLNSFTLWTKN